MLSGFHRREELASPRFDQPQTTVETFSTAEATVGSCPASIALGPLQNMVESVCVPPLNSEDFVLTQQSTHSLDRYAEQPHRPQRLLPQGLVLKNPTGDIKPTRSTDILQSCPRLLHLLTSSNDSSLSQLPKITLRPSAKTTVASFNTSVQPSGSDLSDDKILCLIEKKLKIFRAQMKVLKELGSTNNMSTSPTSTEPERTPENVAVAISEKNSSNSSRPDPESPRMNVPTAKHSAEYVQIIPEAAAIYGKDRPVVLKALSDPPLEKFFKQNPTITVHHKPSNEEYRSMRQNGNPGQLSPKSLETFNQQPCITDNQTSHLIEMSEQNQTISPAVCNNLTLHLNLKSSVANYQQRIELEQNEQMEKLHKKEGQTAEGRLQMELFPCKSDGASKVKDPKYEDVTDDEEFNVMLQLSTHHNDCQMSQNVSMQLPEQIPNVNDNANGPSDLALTPTPQQQGPEMPLTCTCPYFVETDEGFEKMPCPKCAKETLPIKKEVQSEDESEVILFVTELVLMDEVIVVDSDGNDDEQNVSSPEQHNQHARFQKIEEYDTIDSFLQLKLKQKNLPNPLAVEKVASEPVLSNSSLQKHKSKGIFEKVSKNESDAEDSCDTEDSLDYPSHTKSNYLTASNQVRALSPQPCDPDSAEEGEVHSTTPEETSSTGEWFPNLSPDETEEDEGSANNPINNVPVLPKTTTRKAKFKSRHVTSSDSESENDQDVSKTRRRSQNSSPLLRKSKKSRTISSDLDSDEIDQDRSRMGRKTSETVEASTQPPKPSQPRMQHEKVFKSHVVSIDSTLNRDGNKTHKRSLSVDSSDASTQPPQRALKPRSSQAVRLEPNGQNELQAKALHNVQPVHHPAMKRKSQTTGHKSDSQVKRKMPSSEVKSPGPEINALPVHEGKAQLSKLIMSKARKPNGQFGSKVPSLSYQSDRKPSGIQASISGILSLEGEDNYASSRPLNQPTPNTTPNQIRPTQTTARPSQNQIPPTPNTVRTSAKERQVREWEKNHVPIREERRRVQNVRKQKLQPKPRQRYKSQDPETALLRKTKHEAQQLTKDKSIKKHQCTINQPVGEGYKWRDSKLPASYSLLPGEFLEKYGGNYPRPHDPS